MNPWCALVAGYCLGSAIQADGIRAPTWVRWLGVVMAIFNLWAGSL